MPSPSRDRPLSPHLQVYRLPMTALMSVAHRATGAALAIGTLLVLAVLFSAASGESAYNSVINHVNAWYGKVALFGWTFCMFYHMSNGVRHLIWDTGRLFKLENARKAGYIVLSASVLLTLMAWGI